MAYGSIPSSVVDPVYGCHWWGASKGSPSGDRCWGLDDADNAITGNTVNIDTYLNATQQYINYCVSNSLPTKVFFTTGTVDNTHDHYTVEKGYQAYLKMEYIRNYVKADATRILFDYADILTHDDDGSLTTSTWNGKAFSSITATNLGVSSIGHIGPAGTIRLVKAMWWMLARMAGWDGGTTSVPVTGITVTGAGGATTVNAGGTLQLSVAILPSNATNKTVTWSVTNGTGQATISLTRLLTAVSNGTVTARATSNDGSDITGTIIITINSKPDTPFIAIVDGDEMRFPIDESYIGCKISMYKLNGNLISNSSC